MAATVHVIGAGLAGLSAAVSLAAAGRQVMLHEATRHAGGRCRTYFDRALDMDIDNGNHIILSGNRSALAYLDRIGARDRISGPKSAQFDFFDLATGEKWRIDLGSGLVPWWIFDRGKRVPGTRLADYLALLPLSLKPGSGTVAEAVNCREPLYGRLLEPMLLATLNNEPRQSSARLAAAVLRETVARGGRNCRPLVAHDGLSAAFVDPALAYLEGKGGTIRLGDKLNRIRFGSDLAKVLEFNGGERLLGKDDAVVLAVPPDIAVRLVPDLTTPDEFRSIANIHFRLENPLGLPPMTGVVNGLTQWIFQFADRVSVTISNAGAAPAADREELARSVWSEIMRVAGGEHPMPAWQVVHERRATFATVPEQEAKRPAQRTRWKNLVLAGDWVATGLPPTIEGAIRSGHKAAELIATEMRRHG